MDTCANVSLTEHDMNISERDSVTVPGLPFLSMFLLDVPDIIVERDRSSIKLRSVLSANSTRGLIEIASRFFSHTTRPKSSICHASTFLPIFHTIDRINMISRKCKIADSVDRTNK